MKKMLLVAVCFMSGVLLLRAFAQTQNSSGTKQPRVFKPAEFGKSIAGIPTEEALRIYERHGEELRTLPGSVSVSFTGEGLVVETVSPESLPTNVEGLPVIPIPPIDSDAVGALQKGLPARGPGTLPSPPDPSEIVTEPPPPLECPSSSAYDPETGRCRRSSPTSPKTQLKLLPPPAGVIVLKPGKNREHADSCPPEFQEVKDLNEWRFCVDPIKPEPIPPLMIPPIAGIAYEKALEILECHRERLLQIPGVFSVGMGIGGIRIEANNPDEVPKEIDGLPVEVIPYGGPGIDASHSQSTPIRPLRSALAINDTIFGSGQGWKISQELL